MPAFFGGLPHLPAFLGVAPQRLLADDVFAGLGRGDVRLGVDVVRSAVVEHLHVGVVNELTPIGVGLLVAIALGRFLDGFLIAAGDRYQARDGDRWIHHVRQLLQRVAVGLAHEGIAEHAHADRRGLPFGARPGHGHESDFV